MKKLLLSLIIATTFATQVSAQCNGFYDGFESGLFTTPWTMGTGTYTMSVPSSGSAVGTYHLSMSSTVTNSFYQGPMAMFTPSQPTYISWWAKTDNGTSANGYVVIGDANVASDNGILFCYFTSGSALRFFNTTGYNYPITLNTWHHIEVMNINWTSRTMDIYVDGVLILTAWAFRSGTATTMDRVLMHSLNPANVEYDDFTIGNPAVTATSTQSAVSCFGGSNGSATVVASGGNGTYTYSWSPSGGTAATATGLAAGTYVCTITDGTGCTNTQTVTVTEPTPLMTAAANSGNVCPWDTTMLIGTALGGTMSYTYTWLPGNLNGSVVSTTPGGTTTYSLVVTDANGCVDTSTTTVTVYTAPMVALGSDITQCGGNVMLDAGNVGSAYLWSESSTTQMITVNMSGVYDVAVTDTNGCMGYDTIGVTINPMPVVVGSAAMNFVCTGEPTVQLFGSPANGTWTGPGVFGSTFEPDTAGVGIHSLVYTFTDSAGCTGVDTVSINVDLCLGVNDGYAISYNVYPNPNSGTFSITVPTALPSMEIVITDVQGRIVYSSHDENVSAGTTKQISLANEAAGIYVMQVVSGDAVSTYRVSVVSGL